MSDSRGSDVPGQPAGRRGLFRLPDWTIVAGLLGLFVAQSVPGILGDSPTYDEPAHLTAGYLHLAAGDYRFNSFHPPLVKMLAAAPLLFAGLDIPREPRVGDRFARSFFYQRGGGDRLLRLGRLSVLPLALGLGTLVFVWARRLWGRGAAALALTLYVFEPSILAHGRLTNTDLGAACGIALAVWALYRLAGRVSPGTVAAAGLAVGLALLAKLSGLLLLPMFGVLLAVTVLLPGHRVVVRLPGRPRREAASPRARAAVLLLAVAVAGLVAYACLWAGYRFRFAASPADALQAYPATAPPLARGALQAWARTAHLLPEAYLDAIGEAGGSAARASFVTGGRTTGTWYYFFVTAGLKTPLGLFGLLALAGLAAWRARRTRALALAFLIVPVLLYFGIATAMRLNIGHRHLLPIYPFLLVFASAVVPWARTHGRAVQGVVGLLVAWYVVSSVAVLPHHLAYFNELAGGPAGGYRYLVDSNLDWGQDLKRLKRFMDDAGIERVWLSYFGTASPAAYGIRYNYLPGYPFLEVPRAEEATPWVAISATNLQGVYLHFAGVDRDYFASFRRREPVARVGYSIFVYRLD